MTCSLGFLKQRKAAAFSICIDLSKHFDTIDHSILFAKLKYYGIIDVSCYLIYNYLSNRKKCFVFNDTKSDFVYTSI